MSTGTAATGIDRPNEAVTLHISQIYRAWGRYEEALKLLEQSLAIRGGRSAIARARR